MNNFYFLVLDYLQSWVILTIRTFFEAKNSFLWILNIKIKISMTCVSKEYEIKTKMVQQQWLQLKMFWLSYNLKIVDFWWG